MLARNGIAWQTRFFYHHDKTHHFCSIINRFLGSWMNICCKRALAYHGVPLTTIPVIRSQTTADLDQLPLTHVATPPVDLLFVGQPSTDGTPALTPAFDKNSR